MNLQLQDYEKLVVPTFSTPIYQNIDPVKYQGYVVPHIRNNVEQVIPKEFQVKSNVYLAVDIPNFLLLETVAIRIFKSQYLDVFALVNPVNKQITFACVCAVSWIALRGIIYTQEKHKRDWYEVRNRDFDGQIDKLTDKMYARIYKTYLNQAIKVTYKLKDWFGELYHNLESDKKIFIKDKYKSQIKAIYKNEQRKGIKK